MIKLHEMQNKGEDLKGTSRRSSEKPDFFFFFFFFSQFWAKDIA